MLFSNLLYFTPVSSTSDKYMFIFAVKVNDMFSFFINLEMTSDKTDIWHLLDLTNNTETNWFGTAQSLNGRWQIITREFQNLSLGQIILYSEKISILTILETSIKINKLHHCPFQGKCWRKSGLWTMSTIAIY